MNSQNQFQQSKSTIVEVTVISAKTTMTKSETTRITRTTMKGGISLKFSHELCNLHKILAWNDVYLMNYNGYNMCYILTGRR